MTTMVREEAAVAGASSASRHVAAANAACERFFTTEADAIARACQAMAMRFQQRGRLLVHAPAAGRSDVSHVVVEFVHPVIVGKRALPALAIASESELETMAQANDILLLLSTSALSTAQVRMRERAQARGLLAVSLIGGRLDAAVIADDHTFAVPSNDACVVQEAHEMLYHILWELVHVFFEHRAVNA